MSRQFYVYILASRISGTIYVEPGLSQQEVTELVYRIGDHQENTRTGSSANQPTLSQEG